MSGIWRKVIHSSFALSYGGRFAEKCLDFSKANYFSLGWFVKNPAVLVKALETLVGRGVFFKKAVFKKMMSNLP
jgi:hypothetical protein